MQAAPRNRGQSWRYAARGFNPNGRQSTRYESTVQQPPSPPLGPLLQTLSEADLLASDQSQSSSEEEAEITNCTYIASFNWLDHNEPTILVPGKPPAWTPLDEPSRLEEDKGDYYRDLNAARFPHHPLEPAVRALLTEQEDLEAQEIDLFACSSTVGSLLRFVRRIDKPFRFFVEVVGHTVFFTRHENAPDQLIVGVRGYGHTFPEAYTTWDADVKGSTSHQRLLRYNFAGLDCLLRFECDGYLPSKVSVGVDAPVAARDGQQIGDDEDNDLAFNLDHIKVSSSLVAEKGKHKAAPLEIKKSGQKVPQEAVFDLKTRSSKRKDLSVLEDELPRYWLAQIPNFILARHDGGMFHDITVQHIQGDVQEWEGANQKDLRRLIRLLREIIAAVKGRKDGKLEVCCKGMDALDLREQDTDEHDVLPPELKLRWRQHGQAEGGKSESDDKRNGGEAFPATGSDVSENDRYFGFGSDEESGEDFTACSADSCGYCGHCSY